jgi:hypothetical protein
MKKLISIYIIKAHPLYSYFTAQTYDVPADQARELILSGNAREATLVLPLDLPGREAILSAGIETLTQLAEIGDFTKIKGIGRKTAFAITDYLLES